MKVVDGRGCMLQRLRLRFSMGVLGGGGSPLAVPPRKPRNVSIRTRTNKQTRD